MQRKNIASRRFPLLAFILPAFILLAFILVYSLAAQEDRGLVVRTEDGSTLTIFTRSYALVIGESDYTTGWQDLPGVSEDVRAVKRLFEEQGFTVETIENGNSRNLKAGIEDFLNRYGYEEDTRLLVYYAGHGHTLQLGGNRDMGYIVPVDAPSPHQNQRGFQQLAIPMQQFDAWARMVTSRHVLFIFDSCFSGSVFAISRAVPGIIDYKTANPVRQFIASGAADETVPDKSVFRTQLEAGLRGREADLNNDGYVSGSELGDFLQSTVVNYSYNTQHPQYGKIRDAALDKGDFVFAVGVQASGGNVPSPVIVPPVRQNSLFPPPFQVKTIGQYTLNQDEYISDILLDTNDDSYTLMYKKRNRNEYYVRQGSRAVGPFSYIYNHNETWYAKDNDGRYFIGSARAINGPIFNIAGIISVQNLDDRRLAYIADTDANEYILQNGLRREGPYQYIGNLSIAPVTGKIAYIYRSGNQNYIAVDGKSYGPYGNWVEIIGWSSDGEKCAFYYGNSNGASVMYGGNNLGSYGNISSISFAPDGKTLIFIGDGYLYKVLDTGNSERIGYDGIRIGGYTVSNDGTRLGYIYRQNNSQQYYITATLPGGGSKTYGTFTGRLQYGFSPNSEIFYCIEYNTATGQQVMYVNDEKYTFSNDTGSISPVFSSEGSVFAAFFADISGSGPVLQTDTMTVPNVNSKMGTFILPDGSPVYWTRDSHLHISYESHGPFDYIAERNDKEYIQWILCDKGNIQVIKVKR